ncbi:hypothetical protein HD806DRAFT_332465 [Xylariaceae sp. AK1471]|nr:hypothetical protein HD806DRAFT_332465 [Xylariaceae sp. AK1471]
MASRPKYTTWTEEVHEDIMIAMFETIQPNPAQFAEVVENLQAKGHTFSLRALKYASPLCRLSHVSFALNNILLRRRKNLPLPYLLGIPYYFYIADFMLFLLYFCISVFDYFEILLTTSHLPFPPATSPTWMLLSLYHPLHVISAFTLCTTDILFPFFPHIIFQVADLCCWGCYLGTYSVNQH